MINKSAGVRNVFSSAYIERGRGSRIGSAMKKSLVTDSAGWCFSVYSALTRI